MALKITQNHLHKQANIMIIKTIIINDNNMSILISRSTSMIKDTSKIISIPPQNISLMESISIGHTISHVKIKPKSNEIN
jgi:hypothetical protein